MDFLLAFMSLLGICFALTLLFGFNAASTPLVSMSIMMLVVGVFGVFDLLPVGFALLYVLGAVGLVVTIVKKRPKIAEIRDSFIRPGIIFFIVTSVFFFFILKDIDPDFRYWDEYSFWGIAAKTMWTERKLYTLVNNSMIVSAYLPGLPITGLLFQFFSRTFTEWKVYLGYDVLMMAGFSALFGNTKWKNPLSILVTSAFSLTAIYAFFIGSEGLFAYANSYADFPLGIVFGSILLLWFVPSEKNLQQYISVVISLMALTFMKDMGLAMGMVAAGVIAFDIWLSRKYPIINNAEKRPIKVFRFFAIPLIPMSALCAVYFAWLRHFTSVTGIVSSDIGYKYSMFEIFSGKDPYFIDTIQRMIDALSVRQIISFGPMKTMILAFVVTSLLTCLASRKKQYFIRIVSFSILMFAGFAVYYLFHAYLYTAVFYHSGAMSSYSRYMSTYSIGWLISIAGISTSELGDTYIKHFEKVWAIVVMAATIFTTFYFNPVHPDQYVITYKKKNLQRLGLTEVFQEDFNKYGDLLDVSDRFYFVCQDSNGGEWFLFNYEFLPAYTVSTLGGGNFVPEHNGGLYDAVVRKDDFVEYLTEQDVEFVYICKSNEYFREEFGELFKDHLESFYDGSANIYYIVKDENGMQLVPIFTREGLELIRSAS